MGSTQELLTSEKHIEKNRASALFKPAKNPELELIHCRKLKKNISKMVSLRKNIKKIFKRGPKSAGCDDSNEMIIEVVDRLPEQRRSRNTESTSSMASQVSTSSVLAEHRSYGDFSGAYKLYYF